MSFGRLKQHIEDIVDAILRKRNIDYLAMYPSAVVSQNSGTFTLELLPDDERVRGFGLKNVPVRWGLPGTRATVAAGERVLLGWENGDPSLPYAALWSFNSVTSIEMGDALGTVVREGNLVTVGASAGAITITDIPALRSKVKA